MKCQQCQGRSQLYLCNTCTNRLRDMYRELAIGPELPNGHLGVGLLEHLRDTATGNCHIGQATPRNHTAPHAPSPDSRAVALLAELHQLLTATAAELPVADPITCPAAHIVPEDFIGPLPPGWRRGEPSHYTPSTEELALWLARHARVIAAGERAKATFGDLKAITERVLRAIDRPASRRFCGPCPGNGTERCGTRLMAHPDAKRIKCPDCGTSHNVEALLTRLFGLVGGWSFTRERLLGIMAAFGQPIGESTFRRWRATGLIHPTGYLTPEGKRVGRQRGPGDQPVYRLNDARKLKTRHGEILATV